MVFGWFKTWALFINVFLLCLAVFPKEAFTQCHNRPESWLKELSSIELSGEEIDVKIEKAEILRKKYLICFSKRDSILARVCHRLGSFYSENYEMEKAIELSEEAVSINKQNDPGAERPYLANTYFNLGVLYTHLNTFTTSIKYYDSAFQVAIKYDDKRFIALLALHQISYSYFQLKDFEKSVEVSENGLLFLKDSDDKLYEAILRTQKAQSLIDLEQLHKAESDLQKAYEILSSLDSNQYLATLFYVYARLNIKRKNFDEAASFYKKSYQINLDIKNTDQCARDLLDLGYLFDNNLNAPEKALETFKAGLEMFKNKEPSYLLSALYTNIGVVYWRQKEFDTALRYYQKSLNSLPLKFNDSSLHKNPSESQLKLVSNDYFVYQTLANKARTQLELFKEKNDKENLSHALETFKLADRMVGQMRHKQVKEASKAYWRETTKKVYSQAIETCFLLNDVKNAFYFFEKSRAILLNDKLNSLHANQLLSDEAFFKEQKLRNKIGALQNSLAAHKEMAPEYRNIQEELYKNQGMLEQYIKSLEETNPLYFQYKYDNYVPSIEEAQQKILKGNKALIEYFNTDEYLYTLTINPDTVSIQRFKNEELYDFARELNYLCSNKTLLNSNYSRFADVSHALYKILVEPLNIKVPKVIISNDELFIPFEVLLSSPLDDKSFLIKDLTISYTYSASFLLKTKDTALPEKPNLLGIAPEEFSSSMQKAPLLGAAVSLNKIKPYFYESEFLINEAATKSQFLKKLPAFSVVQLYSHAEADTSGEASRIYFYDSALNINELQILSNLQTNLIILSACKTGVGKLVKGEGVFSVSRSFAAAGIPSVITNLWDIDNHSTYKLTELFYKYLNRGYEYDEALQKAKVEFIEVSDKEQQLPYFWAASVLVGKTDSFMPPPEKHSFLFLLIGIALILFITSLALFVAKRNKAALGNSSLRRQGR